MRLPIAPALILAACLCVTDAGAGTAHLQVNNPAVNEGDGPGTTTMNFVITRSGDTGSAVTLRYQTDDDSAFAPDDYTALPASLLRFGPGQTSKTIAVAVRGDTGVEADETLFLHLTGFVGVVGAPIYAAAGTLAAGDASSIVATDIDGDGRPDLAVVDAGSDSVSLHLNATEPGATVTTYTAAGSFAAGSGASAAIATDIDRDGRADLAVAHAAGDSLSLFFNTTAPGASTATYADAGTFIAGTGVSALAAADINGDGLPDLAVTYADSDSISLFFNTTAPGASTATYADAGTFIAGTGVSALAAADINDDGLPDLAAAYSENDHVSVFFNATVPGAPVAAWTEGGTFDTDSAGAAITATDLDGDALPDLVVAYDATDSVGLFLNRTASGAGAANFSGAGSVSAGGAARSIAAADVNADGLPDLAVVHAGDASVSIRLNRSATFDDSEGAGTLRNDDATPPDAFSFTDQVDVERNRSITSAAVTITGLSTEVGISVEDGKYSIGCTSTFTASSAKLRNGQTVCVRHTSSSSFSTATDTVLKIGGVEDTFTSITLGRDTRPDPFTFTDVTHAPLNSLLVSNSVTIKGIHDMAPVSVDGGEYSIGCTSAFTSTSGAVAKDQVVCVRHTSSAVAGIATHTTLTVGGVSDTFSSITPVADPDAYDAGALGLADLLAGLAALALSRRKKPVRAVALANGSL